VGMAPSVRGAGVGLGEVLGLSPPPPQAARRRTSVRLRAGAPSRVGVWMAERMLIQVHIVRVTERTLTSALAAAQTVAGRFTWTPRLGQVTGATRNVGANRPPKRVFHPMTRHDLLTDHRADNVDARPYNGGCRRGCCRMARDSGRADALSAACWPDPARSFLRQDDTNCRTTLPLDAGFP